MTTELLTRLRFLIFRKKPSELDDELRFHLEQSIEAKAGGRADRFGGTPTGNDRIWRLGAHARTMRETTPWMVDRHGEDGMCATDCGYCASRLAQCRWPW